MLQFKDLIAYQTLFKSHKDLESVLSELVGLSGVLGVEVRTFQKELKGKIIARTGQLTTTYESLHFKP